MLSDNSLESLGKAMEGPRVTFDNLLRPSRSRSRSHPSLLPGVFYFFQFPLGLIERSI